MKHNALRLHAHFSEMVKNPKGEDSLERSLVKSNSVKALADLENRFKTAKKYKDDPEIQALLGIKKEKKEEKKNAK